MNGDLSCLCNSLLCILPHITKSHVHKQMHVYLIIHNEKRDYVGAMLNYTVF